MKIWRHVSETTLLIISCIVLGFGIIAVFVALTHQGASNATVKTPNQGLYILASALFAISGVLFTSAVKLHSEARDAAFKILSKSTDDNDLYKHMRIIRDLNLNLRKRNISPCDFAQYFYRPIVDCDNEKIKSIHAKFCSEQSGPDTTKNDALASIYVVGNFFEEIMVAIRQKEISEEMLYEFYIGMFVRFYDQVKFYLPYLRNDKSVAMEKWHTSGATRLPEVFVGLDELNDRWRANYLNEFNDRL